MAQDHQIVGFHFRVNFINLSKHEDIDLSFQSVTGFDVQMETETIKEGGENRFEHVVPIRRRHNTLILKRGILTPKDSGITKWFQAAFQNMEVKPLSKVNVELLNENHDVLMQWELAHVWPLSWEVAELHAERSEVLIETLKLKYNYFKLISVAS